MSNYNISYFSLSLSRFKYSSNGTTIKSSDFIQKFLGLMNHENYNEQTLQTLADLADLNKDG